MKGGSEYDSMAQLFRLEPWWKITLFLLKTCRDCTNSARKSYQVYSLDTRCTREESGKETSWSQTLGDWNRWAHLKSTRKDSMQRKC